MRRETALQLLVLGAVAALALAANHALFNWVLFTEATMQRVFY
jgi:hypothetical protein